MNTFRFKLEPYHGSSTRHTCPACNKKNVFVRYIDTEKKITFSKNVGSGKNGQSDHPMPE